MHNSFQRRHSRWYEIIVFSYTFQFILGWLFVVALPSLYHWWWLGFPSRIQDSQINAFIANTVAFTFSYWTLCKFKRFPGTRTLSFILPTLTISWFMMFTVFLFLREKAYARQVLLYSFTLAFVWAFIATLLGQRYRKPKLAIVPFGRACELVDSPRAITEILTRPDLEGRRYDGVVADLYTEDLPDEWERFLAACTLARIPVFHTQQLIESLTGRVKIEHLSENIFGTLLPSSFYSCWKRFFETIIILFSLPCWLPIVLIAGIAIKLESKGPIFFIQERVGQRNKDFKVIKLRTMCTNSEKKGAQFAQTNDPRITCIGKFLRKTRIDELPQFFNVLKGEMSLIGPRPEQRAFANQFDEQIPFYTYRHTVKPGITGWAQVNQGYVANADDTQVKIEYDFYYIKNFSLWLDILIVVKTIRTIVTGFGAR